MRSSSFSWLSEQAVFILSLLFIPDLINLGNDYQYLFLYLLTISLACHLTARDEHSPIAGLLTNNLGLRWIEREQPMSNTINLNCATSVETPAPGAQTFQEWFVQRLLARFA
jgi:hypothetical protein